MSIKWNTVLTTVVGGLVAAFVIYQVKVHTKGLIDDE
jgi:hypothetical protein